MTESRWAKLRESVADAKVQMAQIREEQRAAQAAREEKKAEKQAKRDAKMDAFHRKVAIVSLMTNSGVLAVYTDRVELRGGKNGSIPMAEVTDVEVENGTQLVRRSSIMRAGGGAAVGAVVLGPVGLLAGLGLGAMAKKERGGEKFIVIDSPTTTIFAQVSPKDAEKAFKVRQVIRERMSR